MSNVGGHKYRVTYCKTIIRKQTSMQEKNMHTHTHTHTHARTHTHTHTHTRARARTARAHAHTFKYMNDINTDRDVIIITQSELGRKKRKV